MRKFIPAMVAALLISSVPALAAGTTQPNSAAAAPERSQIEEQKLAAQPSDPAASDDDIQLVIMGKTVQVQVPNPYKNPKPHLLTDAWAMRA